MREIQASMITDTIERLCIEANQVLPDDIKKSIQACRSCEDGQIACGILDNIIENYEIAENEQVPICQDTGMACVFLEIGQDVHITGGDLSEAVDEGVRRGYTNGYLRKSVVKDPVRRGNTGDNTPAMLYTEIVPGENIKITVGPKGFGSENMSAIRMFKPSAGIEGNEDPYYADLEKEMLEKINQLGIGPQGFGGKTTALGLNVETMPTHIAGMPCAINISCHVTRHKTEVI